MTTTGKPFNQTNLKELGCYFLINMDSYNIFGDSPVEQNITKLNDVSYSILKTIDPAYLTPDFPNKKKKDYVVYVPIVMR